MAWGLSHMSALELKEWEAFASREPIGETRSDLRNALLASILAEVNRDPEKRSESFSPLDFIVDYWRKPITEQDRVNLERITEEHNKSVAYMLASIGVGTITKEGE